MGLIVRLLLILIGFIASMLAASLFINILLFGGFQQAGLERELLQLGLFVSVPVLAGFIGYHAFAPTALVILFGEFTAKRDWLYYAVTGAIAAIAALFWSGFGLVDSQPDIGLSAVAAAAGAVGGLAYWLVAGRSAGRTGNGPISPAS
ncbi:MAG: hypothetical protein ACRECW_17300 [Phyllobacterium sp.]